MNVIEYTSDKYPGKIFTMEYDLDDLMEGITEFDMATVKKICIEFLDMMVRDLIERNDYFLFPIWKFAYITITDICNVNHPEYSYDVIKGTDSFFQPVISGEGSKKIHRKQGIRYIIRFLGKTQQLFESSINSGHKY